MNSTKVILATVWAVLSLTVFTLLLNFSYSLINATTGDVIVGVSLLTGAVLGLILSTIKLITYVHKEN